MKLKPRRKVETFVFGPYDSRRFGRSLGVNPLPAGPKRCTFDCAYCECGIDRGTSTAGRFPSVAEIRSALERETAQLSAEDLDSITIAGNGEPTLYPDITRLVEVVVEARDRYWPRARTVILTNGTQVHLPVVRASLEALDDRVVKLDAGNESMLTRLNRPFGHLPLEQLVDRIAMIGDIAIQSMFVHGFIDNTRARDVEEWVRRIGRIGPASVQVYSIDRVPAMPLLPVGPRELARIAAYAQKTTGIPVQVY